MNGPRVLPAVVALLTVGAIALAAWVIAGTPGSTLRGDPDFDPIPTATGDDFVTVTVGEGDSAADIAGKLADARVIRSEHQFRILVAIMGVGDELVSGDYEFDRPTSVLSAVSRLRRGDTLPLTVTIPEGMRIEEIAAILDVNGVVPGAAFLTAVAGPQTFAFLEERPAGVGLEGYLFPATYGFSRAVTAEQAVRQMLTAFDQRVTPEIRQSAAAQGLSLHQLVTLASIVEREAVVAEERPLIAGVFLNRLRAGIALEADPTVQYAVANANPGGVFAYGWWKRDLTESDLLLDSPYNTYARAGLPPGPIANPGLASIEAVASPQPSGFLYFVARPDGSHAFASTFEQHLENIERYAR